MLRILKLLPCLSLVLAASGGAMAADHFWMGDKEVTREYYAAITMMNEAVALMHANHNQEAVDKLLQAQQLAPDAAEIHSDLGLALAKVGRTAEGVDQLRQAVALKPQLDVAWITLGGLYQSMGQLDEAIKVYKEFVARFPKNPQTPKIASLAKGLDTELKRQQAAAPGAAQAPAPAPVAAPPDGSATPVAAAAVASPGPADDYLPDVTRDGRFRWPAQRMPLRVYIAPGTGVRAYRPEMETILKQCFIDWSTVSGGLVKFAFVGDPKQSDIECSFTGDVKTLANQAEAGQANVQFDKQGISHAFVKILTVPLSPDFPMSDNRLRTNCLHEVGHALGLLGHTTRPDDIMFYASKMQDEWRSLSDRDAHTLVRLYSN